MKFGSFCRAGENQGSGGNIGQDSMWRHHVDTGTGSEAAVMNCFLILLLMFLLVFVCFPLDLLIF